MKKIELLLIVFSLITVWSCKDKEDDIPTGTKGTIYGEVNLYDEGTTSLSNEDMIVSVFGSNPPIIDTTDKDGKFEFNNLDFGTYAISYEKTGYGFSMLSNISHQKEATIITYTRSLGQLSSTKISSISAKDSLGSIFIQTKTDPIGTQSSPIYYRIFYHTMDAVSFDTYSALSPVIETKNNSSFYRLNPHALENMGFQTGETVWIKVYGESFYSNDYIEPIKGKHIFPNLNLNSAAAVSFIVP